MKNVFCIGELLIDFVAENQGSDLTKATQFTKKAGGAPANVACAISKLGGRASFVGAVGKDAFGMFLRDTLVAHRVDISELQLTNTFTTLAFVSIAEDGERDFVFSRGADRELVYKDELKEQLENQIVHFGAATSFLGGALETSYTQYLEDAIDKNTFICFDPNFRGDLWNGNETVFVDKCLPFISKAHLCKFSLEEAQLLSGKEDMHQACDVLHNLGVDLICITLGAEGTLLSSKEKKQVISSTKVKAVDTTGAGDAFIGCLLYQLSALNNPLGIVSDFDGALKMIEIANKAGAITTTKFGAIDALPMASEVF